MATRSKDQTDGERLREAIRQLNLALKQCHKLLDQVEGSERAYEQDNEPAG
jgi:hypothetical protein